jgi:hypothetical protein
MNRLDWYNNQTKEVQEKFRNNCIKSGGEKFFNRWISIKIGITTGIVGAFVFRKTDEGVLYWSKINADCTNKNNKKNTNKNEESKISKSSKRIKSKEIIKDNHNNKFGIRRIVNRVFDENGMCYDEVSYHLISLFGITDENDSLDGDWEFDLFEFIYCNTSNSIVSLDIEEIDEVEPSEDENFLFSELDNLFEKDIEQYGDELENIIKLDKIKSYAQKFIEE